MSNPKIIIVRHEADVQDSVTEKGQVIIRKQMRVLHSTHPKFITGKKFDYGYLSISLDDGYAVTILPL